MKDKKWLLSVLKLLIIVLTFFLGIILVFGGLKDKQVKKFEKVMETAACKLAEDEGYTESICRGFENLCQVHYEKLISRKYIDENLKNPLNHKKVKEDKNSYILVSWQDDKIKCTHKEG